MTLKKASPGSFSVGKHAGGMFVAENEMRQHRNLRKAAPFFETVDKVYSYTKIHCSKPDPVPPAAPGRSRLSFQERRIRGLHPLKPL